jgi:hypothetical protein
VETRYKGEPVGDRPRDSRDCLADDPSQELPANPADDPLLKGILDGPSFGAKQYEQTHETLLCGTQSL